MLKLKMIRRISIKTRVGWISAFENKSKIFEIRFGRLKKKLLEFEKTFR